MLIHFDFTLSNADAEFLMHTLDERVEALAVQGLEQLVARVDARGNPSEFAAVEQKIVDLQEEIARVKALKRQMINTAI